MHCMFRGIVLCYDGTVGSEWELRPGKVFKCFIDHVHKLSSRHVCLIDIVIKLYLLRGR